MNNDPKRMGAHQRRKLNVSVRDLEPGEPFKPADLEDLDELTRLVQEAHQDYIAGRTYPIEDLWDDDGEFIEDAPDA